MAKKDDAAQITRYADMLSAMGTEPRLRIMQLLLSAHPEGLVVGDIGSELNIPASTLSHHLEKLKNEDLVRVRRDGTFLWYSAHSEALEALLGFLYAECCTRNKAVRPQRVRCAQRKLANLPMRVHLVGLVVDETRSIRIPPGAEVEEVDESHGVGFSPQVGFDRRAPRFQTPTPCRYTAATITPRASQASPPAWGRHCSRHPVTSAS